METVFPEVPVVDQASWTIDIEKDLLRTTLRRAAERAADTGRTVLASILLPVPFCDALRVFHVFQQVHGGPVFFWEQPGQQKALVGVGTACEIKATGPERFAQATSIWRAWQQNAIVAYAGGTTPEQIGGPIFFGGFAFDPQLPHTALWEGFPDGLLVLPRLLFYAHQQHPTLTMNVLVEARSDLEAGIEHITSTLKCWQSILQQLSGQPSYPESDITQPLIVRDIIPRDEWEALVARAVEEIRHGSYAKVVLARDVEVMNGQQPFDVPATLARLRASYPGAYVFAMQRDQRYFVGATPERLVYGQDGRLRTMALAGSAPRGATPEEDRRLGSELLHSHKNKDEHEIVAWTIRDALATLCSKVWVADTPHLLQLKNIQHLETPIVGELLPGHCVLEALAGLHPTPAVGGYPRQEALDAIRDYEQLDRGWYAGPVGWIDAQGNGEFAVALRSGLVDGNRARLFAGCGIVAESQPESEYIESCLKLNVMLRGLGGEDER